MFRSVILALALSAVTAFVPAGPMATSSRVAPKSELRMDYSGALFVVVLSAPLAHPFSWKIPIMGC